MSRLYTILLVLSTFWFANGYAAHDGVTSASATAKGASAPVLYLKYCSVCHGEKGDGKSRVQLSLNPSPRDFTSPESAIELTRERMIHSVTYGRPGTAMVAHKTKLSQKEIEEIVDYIRANLMQIPASPEQMAHEKRGRAIYKKNCSACHGDKGSTAIWARNGLNPPPRDFTTDQAKEELSRERMILSVTYGRPGTAMMPFSSKLAPEEIGSVVDYIRSAFMKIDNDQPKVVPANGHMHAELVHKPSEKPDLAGAGNAAPSDGGPERVHDRTFQTPHPVTADVTQHAKVDMSLPMPNGLQGNAAHGREFFQTNCFVCHGTKGNGNGPRSHFITPPPRNFTSELSRMTYNRPRLFAAITGGKKGTVMPAWGRVLNEQQIADVAEYVFQTFIQPDNNGANPQKQQSEAQTGQKKKALLMDNAK
jgi:mono/diheme cytochrome c family protein